MSRPAPDEAVEAAGALTLAALSEQRGDFADVAKELRAAMYLVSRVLPDRRIRDLILDAHKDVADVLWLRGEDVEPEFFVVAESWAVAS